MLRLISLLTIVVTSSIVTWSPNVFASPCGNGTCNGSEACDPGGGAKVPVFCGGATCASFGFNAGSLTCNSDCTIDATGCYTVVVDAGVDAEVDASVDASTATSDASTTTTDSTTGPAGTSCSPAPSSYNTSFAAGSLIIPMDTCTQPQVLRALGLIWFLLKYGIRINWVLDTDKTAMDAVDFSVTNPSGAPVAIHTKSLTDPTDFDTSSVSSLSCVSGNTIPYLGNPYVIPAADAEKALQLIYDGVLPEDPTVKFGYKHVTTFAGVALHRAEVDFDAPVEKIVSTAPKRIALITDLTDFGSWILDFLSDAGLDFTGSGGTPSSPGIIYDRVTIEEAAAGELINQGYHVLWMPSYEYGNNVADAEGFKAIVDFWKTGKAVIAMDETIGSFEQLYKDLGHSDIDDKSSYTCPEDSSCTTESRFMTPNGIIEGSAGSGFTTQFSNPGHPMLQIGDMEFKGMGGIIKTWKPENSSSYLNCVSRLATTGFGVDLVATREVLDQGPVVYIGGHQWEGMATHKLAARRIALNTLFSMVTRFVGIDPPHELTRSSPVVVDGPGATTGTAFQGSFVIPAPTQNLVFDPARPTDWNYPAYVGHMRAYSDSALTDTTTQFDQISNMWDAAANIPASGSRTIYTASSTGSDYYRPLTAIGFNTAQASTLATRLGLSASESALMITQVRAGSFGGVDLSTPAYLPESAQITFQSGYHRPPFILAATLGGMLHAFKVKDVEADTGSWGSELWAFIPPDQLPLLRDNDQSLQASPAIVDLYDDFYDGNGDPGQDGNSEWVTLVVMPSGTSGNTVYAIDVTNPDPSNTICPVGQGTTCVGGPKPLWQSSPTGMGNSYGASIGLINCGSAPEPIVVIATNDGTAAQNQGGLRVFGLDARTGEQKWIFTHQYTRLMPEHVSEPNEIMGTPALVDKSGTIGCQTHAYVGDLEGKVWEIDLETGQSTTGTTPMWDAVTEFGGSSTVANYPISAPVSLYRDDQQQLHVVIGTGGAYWAPSTATISQKIVDITRTGTSVSAVIQTLPAGERVYAAPLIAGSDIYSISSAGFMDLVSPEMEFVGGMLTRINLSTGAATVLISQGMSMSSAGVSASGRVVATAVQGTSVVGNSGADTTSTKPQSQESGSTSSQVRIWLPNLE